MDRYKYKLQKEGLLNKAWHWLKKNPPPENWRASKWAWAWLEMPVFWDWDGTHPGYFAKQYQQF